MGRDGAIVAAGGRHDATPVPRVVPVVWRLHADGTFDTRFGDEGEALALPDEEVGDRPAVVALPSGHVAVSTDLGNTKRAVTILRPDGTIEPSFGQAGVVAQEHYWDGEDIGVGPGGRLLVTNTFSTNGSPTTAEVRAYLPDLPTLSPTITSVTPAQAALSVQWDPAEVETGGPVRVQHLIAFDGETVAAQRLVAGDVRQASLTGLTNGKTYRIVVVPYTTFGQGLASDGVTGTPASGAPAATAAIAVQNLTVTTGRRFATVSWSPPANDGGTPIAAYSVIAVRPSTNELIAWRNVPADVRTASVLTPSPGAVYDLYVLPVTSAGFGAVAPAAHVTAVDAPPEAGQPQMSWATAAAAGSTGYVSWGPANERGEAVTAYNVVVFHDGQMASWQIASPEQRQVAVPIGSTGAVQVYVFAQSTGGWGPIGAPITVR